MHPRPPAKKKVRQPDVSMYMYAPTLAPTPGFAGSTPFAAPSAYAAGSGNNTSSSAFLVFPPPNNGSAHPSHHSHLHDPIHHYKPQQPHQQQPQTARLASSPASVRTAARQTIDGDVHGGGVPAGFYQQQQQPYSQQQQYPSPPQQPRLFTAFSPPPSFSPNSTISSSAPGTYRSDALTATSSTLPIVNRTTSKQQQQRPVLLEDQLTRQNQNRPQPQQDEQFIIRGKPGENVKEDGEEKSTVDTNGHTQQASSSRLQPSISTTSLHSNYTTSQQQQQQQPRRYTPYELVAVLNAQELWQLQTVCGEESAASANANDGGAAQNNARITSTSPKKNSKVNRGGNNTVPPTQQPPSSDNTLSSYLSHLQSLGETYSSVEELISSVTHLAQHQQQTQQQQQQQQHPHHSTPYTTASRTAIITYLSSRNNHLFSECPVSVPFTFADLAEIFSIAGEDSVKCLKEMSEVRKLKFVAVDDLKQSLSEYVQEYSERKQEEERKTERVRREEEMKRQAEERKKRAQEDAELRKKHAAEEAERLRQQQVDEEAYRAHLAEQESARLKREAEDAAAAAQAKKKRDEAERAAEVERVRLAVERAARLKTEQETRDAAAAKAKLEEEERARREELKRIQDQATEAKRVRVAREAEEAEKRRRETEAARLEEMKRCRKELIKVLIKGRLWDKKSDDSSSSDTDANKSTPPEMHDSDLDTLLALGGDAIKKAATTLRILKFVNTQSSLLIAPAKLSESESDAILEIFSPRTVDDAIDELREMNAAGESHRSGAELISAVQIHKAAAIAAVKAYLGSDVGRGLFSSPDTADLRDVAVYDLVASGHGVESTLDYCARLAAAGAAFATTPDLNAAIRTAHEQDQADKAKIQAFVNDESKLLQSPTVCTNSDATTLLTFREGRSLDALLDELRRVDSDALESYATVDEVVAAVQKQRSDDGDDGSDQSKSSSSGKEKAASSPDSSNAAAATFSASIAQQSASDTAALAHIGASLEATVDLCTRLDTAGERYENMDELISGVKDLLVLDQEKKECLAFLQDREKSHLFDGAEQLESSLTSSDIDRIYSSANIGIGTLSEIEALNTSGKKFPSLDDLITALQVRAKELADQKQLLKYVNTESSLLVSPAQLSASESEAILTIYSPRTVDDAIEELREMNNVGSSYKSGVELVSAVQQRKTEAIATIREYLKSDAGKKLFSSPDTADLSDAAVYDLIASGYGVESTLDHCARLAAAGKVFASTPNLSTAIRTAYEHDHADKAKIQAFIDQESTLLNPPAVCDDSDASALLALREGRTLAALLDELRRVDTQKAAPFSDVDDVIEAVQNQRVADAAAERAKLKSQLKSYLEGSGLFINGNKPEMNGSDLDTLLSLGENVSDVISLCTRLDEAKKQYFDLSDLITGVKTLLALDQEKIECLAFLKDTERSQLFDDFKPAGELESSLTPADIDRLYTNANLADSDTAGTFSKIQALNQERKKYQSIDDLAAALLAQAQRDIDTGKVVEYVDTKSALLTSPSVLSLTQGAALLSVYAPRTTDDLLNTLANMNASGVSYPTGDDLITAIQKQKSEDIAALRKYLQSDAGGRGLFTSPDTADLSDDAAYDLIAAGHGLVSALGQCARLASVDGTGGASSSSSAAVRKGSFTTTPDLASAVLASYSSDAADRQAVQAYVNEESKLLTPPTACSDIDAAFLLALRPLHSTTSAVDATAQLIAELRELDASSSKPSFGYPTVSHIATALRAQREAARLKAEQEARDTAATKAKLEEEERARLAEEDRIAREASEAEAARLAELKRIQDEADAAERARLAELKRIQDEADAAERARIDEEERLRREAEAKAAEEAERLRLEAEEAARLKAEEETRLAEEERLRLEEEARMKKEAEQAERAKIRGQLKSCLEGSALFNDDKAKNEMNDSDLDNLLAVGGGGNAADSAQRQPIALDLLVAALDSTISACTRLEKAGEKYTDINDLINGVKGVLGLDEEKKECLAFLQNHEKSHLFDGVQPAGQLEASFTLAEIERLYTSVDIGVGTLAEIEALNTAEKKYSSLDDLISALQVRAKELADRTKLVEYVNTQSSLLVSPAQLTASEGDAILAIYSPRKVGDAIEELREMNDAGTSYRSGAELVSAIQQRKVATINEVRQYLKSDVGKGLFSSPDTADLSDAAVYALIVSGNGVQSTLDHCARLAAAGEVFASTPDLSAAIGKAQDQDQADKAKIQAFVNDESKLLQSPTVCSDADAATLLALREGRTLKTLLDELHRVDAQKSMPFSSADDIVAALQSQRVADAIAERAHMKADLRAYLEGSQLFDVDGRSSGAKPEIDDTDLEQLLQLGGTVSDAIAFCTKLDENKQRFSDVPALITGVKDLLALQQEQQDCLAYLKDTQKSHLFSQRDPEGELEASLTLADIESLYNKAKLGSGILKMIQSLNKEQKKYSSLDQLAAALLEQAQRSNERASVMEYVNTQSSLITSPAQLSTSEADELLTNFSPRSVEDLLDTLHNLNDAGTSYRSGAQLVSAMQKQRAGEIISLRNYLQSDVGRGLFTSPDTADLSDDAVYDALVAGHGYPSTLQQCARLVAAERKFDSTAELGAAIRQGYAEDAKEREIIRKYVNDESALLKVPAVCSETDSAAILALREDSKSPNGAAATQHLIEELRTIDQEKVAPFHSVNELISALQSQRQADAFAEQAKIKSQLKSYLEGSGLFNGIKPKMNDSDLDALLSLARNVDDVIALCTRLDEAKKRYFGLSDLTTGVKGLLALDQEKIECLAFLKDTERSQLFSEAKTAGAFEAGITMSDIERLYTSTKLGLGTLGKIEWFNTEKEKYASFQGLIDALLALSGTLDGKKSMFVKSSAAAAAAAEEEEEEDDEDQRAEDEIAPLISSPKMSPRMSLRSPKLASARPESPASLKGVESDEEDGGGEQTEQKDDNAGSLTRNQSFSSLSRIDRPAKRQDSTNWMNESSAEQLILQAEEADPSIFEEYACMHIRCKNLLHVGKIGMSNVFIQFSRERGHIWERCGGTELVKDDLSPSFDLLILSLQKMCHMKMDRKIKIEAMESATSDGHKPQLIGQIITTPAEIIAKGMKHEWDLKDPVKQEKNSKSYKNSGILIFEQFDIMVNTTRSVLLCATSCLFDDHTHPTQCKLKISIEGRKIEKMDLFGKSDPYCVFFMADGHGKKKQWKEIHRTEVIQNTLNPAWKVFTKSIAEFCDYDYDRRIRCKMYDWDAVGEHDYIGSFDFTVRSMLHSKNKYKIINEEKVEAMKALKEGTASGKAGGDGKDGDKSAAKYKHSGTVTFKTQHFTMLTDIDREADQSLIRHRREYTEPSVNPTKRKAFLAYLAGHQMIVKGPTAKPLVPTAASASSSVDSEKQLGLQRMATSMQTFMKSQVSDETVSFSIRGESLAKMDTFGWCDAYLEFYRLSGSGEWEKAAATEVVKNTLNPKWPPLIVRSKDLLTDVDNPTSASANKVKVKAYDWNKDGSIDEIGEMLTDYPTIRKAKELKFDLYFIDTKNGKSVSDGKHRGTIIFESCRAVQVKTEKKEISHSNTLLNVSQKKEEKKKKEKVQALKRQSTKTIMEM